MIERKSQLKKTDNDQQIRTDRSVVRTARYEGSIKTINPAVNQKGQYRRYREKKIFGETLKKYGSDF